MRLKRPMLREFVLSHWVFKKLSILLCQSTQWVDHLSGKKIAYIFFHKKVYFMFRSIEIIITILLTIGGTWE